MPAYDEATLSPHEVDSIVLYVLNITAHEARGGWRLGRWGPVAEGAAAWLIGVVAVLAAAIAQWSSRLTDVRYISNMARWPCQAVGGLVQEATCMAQLDAVPAI